MKRFILAAAVSAVFAIGQAQAESSPPATPPAKGPNSGSEPGGMGSSGWTGGSGGSHIGIGNDGDAFHSPVATGLI